MTETYRQDIVQITFITITIYNNIILVRSVVKFLHRHFLFIEKVQAFLDLILYRALAREKI